MLGNQSAFDGAFEIDQGSGSRAIIGVETKYHEHAIKQAPPRPAALARYTEVTERSGIFAEGWQGRIVGTDLQQIWLDHLLVLATLQHPSRKWSWGRFVLVYPAGNPSFASAVTRYAAVLADPSSFVPCTLETLVANRNADIAPETIALLRDRYALSDPSDGPGTHR